MGKLVKSGEETIVYQGRLLEIINQDMTDGNKSITFERVRRTPGIRLILINLEKKTVVFTKEHRYELDADDYRLPGGKVFDRLDEFNDFIASKADITVAAKKKAFEEGKEEVGADITTLEHLHTSACGSMIEWDLYYYVSTDWTRTEQKLGLGEEISVVEVPFDEAREIIMKGEMSEERSALILLRYLSSVA